LEYYIPHLGKKLFCVYLWDNKLGRYQYAPELTDDLGDPIPDPENKTITTHEDWQGGPWQDSTYRWVDGKLQLIEQSSLLGDWSQQSEKQCGFNFTCSRLINGEMVTTLEKPICTDDDMGNLPDCPATAPPQPTKSPQQSLKK
jgi:hypothetical protein